MDAIEEKRVYGTRSGTAELLVAASLGVLSVAVSSDRVGRVGLLHRCDPRSLAGERGLAAVATTDDVIVRAGSGPGRGEPGGSADEGRDPADRTEGEADDFRETGFGPAVAVGVDAGEVIAAAPDGRVARFDPATAAGWLDLGRVDAEVRAIDGSLVATSEGVYRLPNLDYAGLEDVRDVAAAGPFAATGGGLYSLGNGWVVDLAGSFEVVAVERRGGQPAGTPRAHAATSETFYERASGEWQVVDSPVDEPVVDVEYGDVPYAVTAEGVLLTGTGDGWQTNVLGVTGVVGCVIG